jgi:hypothetical protein
MNDYEKHPCFIKQVPLKELEKTHFLHMFLCI